MSHLSSADPCKGEKTQNYASSQQNYASGAAADQYRSHHDGRSGQQLTKEQVDDLAHRRELEQLHALSSGGSRDYPPRELMNPGTAAPANPALYPRVAIAPQRPFEGFGLNPPTTGGGGGHLASSSSYRHLIPHNLIPGQFSGLDVMWQQKMNPNPWIVAHYEEMRMERERTMAHHEKERMMAAHEKERMMVHQKERMAHEKESYMAQERERTIIQERERDHERAERQKDDRVEKERQREWEQERLEREERERAQRDAVQQHFEESLRLALQKKSVGWNPIASNKNSGKGQEGNLAMNLQSSPAVRTAESGQGPRDQEKERSQYVDSNHARRDHERWIAMMQQQQRNEASGNASLQNYSAVEPRSIRNVPKSETSQLAGHVSSKPNLAPSPVSSSASQMKNETNFSLYGYQPFQHTYITHAQLKAREETKVPCSTQSVRMSGSGQMKPNMPVKVDKDGFPERPLTPGSSHYNNQSSSKQHLKVMHPGQDRSGIMYQPLVGSGGAFKPYEYSSNSSSPAPPAHQNTSPAASGRNLGGGAAHYQDQPQNLVKSNGKGNQEKINSNFKYNSRDPKLAVSAPNTQPAHFSPPHTSSKSTPPASNTTYSYSLIQQGLVPNPMYIASTHTGSGANASTTSVSFAHSQSSKPSSPPIQQQSSQASPNSGITSGSPGCRPSSVPFTLPPGRISRSYSPVGSLGSYSGNATSGKPLPQDLHVSNRTHLSASHRSPSPAHAYGAQPNPGASNSPHQASPRLATSNSASVLPGVNATSPFHANSLPENMETSGIPLVKRKLLNDIMSRKRPKSVEDGLPPQLQPQTSVDPADGHIVTPPQLVSNISMLSENQIQDSFANETNPASPAVSTHLAFKPEPVATPPSMPDLLNTSSMPHAELPPDMDHSESQNYYTGLSKFKLSSKSSVHSASAENSMDYSSNSQIQSLPERTVTPANPDPNEEQLSNSSVNIPNSATTSSSSGHPKLKKAWLQRHSENEDKKCPVDESSLDSNKVEPLSQIKADNQVSPAEVPKSEPYALAENSPCDKYPEEVKQETNDSESPGGLKSQDVLPDSSSSESDEETVLKSEKRKHKSKSKGSSSKRSKLANSSDLLEDSVSSPKKEKDGKKKSSEKDSRKGGRKKKGRNIVIEEASKKKGMSKTVGVVKPPEKPSIAHLKKTGEPFLQDGPCCDVAPRLPKCRECRMTPHQRNKKMPNIFCRFYAYRKLRYGKNGTILSAGFSEPSDALEEDLKLWLPPVNSPSLDIEMEVSKFLLTYVGDQFCGLVEMEREAQKLHMSGDSTVTWKRVVQGVREMCDVCETTLFNIHWVCHKCGFVVCIDCYKSRKNDAAKDESSSKDRDDYQWLLCTNRQPHEQEKLMMTQIIAGTALWDVGKSLHDIRKKWNIPTYCICGSTVDQDTKSTTNGICKLMSAVTKCFSLDKGNRETNGSSDGQRFSKKSNKSSVNGLIKQDDGVGGYSSESGGSPLSWLADVALNSSSKASDDQREKDDEEKSSEDPESNADASVDSDDDKNENFSTLRELLIRPTGKMGGKSSGSGASSQKTLTSTLDEVISCVIEQKVRKPDKNLNEMQLLHFTRRFKPPKSERELPPVRLCLLAETQLLYPEVPHLWFGHGKILLLKDPNHSGNLQIFQDQWKRGQPVIVADVGKKLDPSLWNPDSFMKLCGDRKADFVNCLGGSLMQNQPVKKFWEGFDNVNKRMKNEDDESMILKLLDWPPADEFSEVLPLRYDDLMKVLPLPQYTHRDGVLNMASHLPDCFVPPDLGPRMYNAYGMSPSFGKGSTNLHLDVSDAINILAYVAFPSGGKEEVTAEIMKALDETGCDPLMKKRVREKGCKPGAIWHVYSARDADKIRDFLNKVSEEQGIKLNPHHDPIHNHEWYLDEKLRNRLNREYFVEPYTIAQCSGDAIFIPAGSPHQVMNIFSCVKISEDFVSPESVGHSFFLTQEIRNLSDNVTNAEDRLQIKNVIYHSVKNALALLQSHDPKESKT